MTVKSLANYMVTGVILHSVADEQFNSMIATGDSYGIAIL